MLAANMDKCMKCRVGKGRQHRVVCTLCKKWKCRNCFETKIPQAGFSKFRDNFKCENCSEAVQHENTGSPSASPFKESRIVNSSGSVVNSHQEKACGIEKSLPGIMFQLRLTEYLIMRSIELKMKFEIFKEKEDCYPFDDIVFKYCSNATDNENSKWNCLFIQAKHKQDENFTITIKDLFIDDSGHCGQGKSNRIFNLTEYFRVYIEKDKEVFSKCKGKVNVLVVFTNANVTLDDNVTRLMNPCKKSIFNSTSIFNYADDMVLKQKSKNPKFLQIKPDYIEKIGRILVSETEMGQLAKELIEAALINDMKLNWENSLFKKYFQSLTKNNIVRIEQTTVGNFGRCSFGTFISEDEDEKDGAQKFKNLLVETAWKIGMASKNKQKYNFASSSKIIDSTKELIAKDVVHELVQLNLESTNKFYFLGHSKINTWIETKSGMSTRQQTKAKKEFVLQFPTMQLENVSRSSTEEFYAEVMQEYFNLYVIDKEIQIDETFKIAFTPENYKALAKALLQSRGKDENFQPFDFFDSIEHHLKLKFIPCFQLIASTVFKPHENESVVFAESFLNENSEPNEYVRVFKQEINDLCCENPNLNLSQLSWVIHDIGVFKDSLVQCDLPKNLGEEFLQKFVLAVHQPDEDQLEELYANCLKRTLNYNCCDEFLYDFQKKTLNWMKSRLKNSLNDKIVQQYIDEYLSKITSYRLLRKEAKFVQRFKKLSI